MKVIGLALAATFIGSVAMADSTTVTRTEGPLGDTTTVRKERTDDSISVRRTESTGSIGGCDTKSVTKTNEFGDSTTKTRTEC